MAFKKACETVEYPIEPVVKDIGGGARWRRGDSEGFDNHGELLPVCLVLP